MFDLPPTLVQHDLVAISVHFVRHSQERVRLICFLLQIPLGGIYDGTRITTLLRGLGLLFETVIFTRLGLDDHFLFEEGLLEVVLYLAHSPLQLLVITVHMFQLPLGFLLKCVLEPSLIVAARLVSQRFQGVTSHNFGNIF